ncbi:hypothetical protein EXIGLDRAFT_233655 [Exidia glandulosa HHB12029]|uniref:C2H2-type domain-containing protein n=1 Tax=Exidia glandulosa HHB12029 TaxID=1314781 RepID=A0A165MIX1_EXIGL|nr:hypothetical protein EXIGLDRAFT_233655 [Exidia glandulosa HHB12029]
MSEDEQPLASTSRTPDPSRPTKAFPTRTVKRTAAVPTSNYAFDTDMGDDNVNASSSRLPKSTDDDDDDFVCPSDADDSEDEDWSLRPKGGQKRKNESTASAERSKKRVRATAPESDAEEEIDDVQEDPNEPEPGVKALEKRYGVYVTSADLRQRKADVKVPDDLRCRPCNKTLADDDSYRRHMVATLKHQPAGYQYYPHMCNLCGQDSGKKKATKSAARMLKEHDALWKDRAVNSRISRRVCDQE